MTNIKKGLHRIAILLITSLSFFLLITQAVAEGYTDTEIVEYLSDKYVDFDINKFKENAQTIKEKAFRRTVIISLFYYFLIAACIYLAVILCGFCIRWVVKGFKPNLCKANK